MNPKDPKQAALARVIDRDLERIPDSMSGRKQYLRDLLAITPTSWKQRAKIASLLIDLHNHERAQLALSQEFKKLLESSK